MSRRIASAPPSPQDSPRVLRDKLAQPIAWTDDNGVPQTDLLRGIEQWPNCWPELAAWIENVAVTFDGGDLAAPPAPPRRSLKERIEKARETSRPPQKDKPAKKRKSARPQSSRRMPDPPAPQSQEQEDGDIDDLRTEAEKAPAVAVHRTISWQNARRPLLILLAAVLAVSMTVGGVAVAREHDNASAGRSCVAALSQAQSQKNRLSKTASGAADMAKNTQPSAVADEAVIRRLSAEVPAARRLLSGESLPSCSTDPQKSQRTATRLAASYRQENARLTNLEQAVTRSKHDRSVSMLSSSIKAADSLTSSDPADAATLTRLEEELATAKKLVKDKKATTVRLDKERTLLDQRSQEVRQSVQKRQDDEKKNQEAQQAQAQSQAQSHSSGSASSSPQTAAPRASVPQQRQSVPRQQQSVPPQPSAPQTWDVPAQGCTEGCL